MDLTVLALHGLTSTTKVWGSLAAALPQARIVAPDLAGRGSAAERRTAPGLIGHADDVVRLADDLGLDGVVLVGHSMGAFLAPLVAARLGPRVRKVLLLDGGVAPERSILVSRPVVRALFWTQMRLLDRRWRSPEAFVDAIEGKAIRNRPDLRAPLLDWARYLLDGDGRPRLDTRRLVADALDSLTGAPTLGALAETGHPVHLIAAARGAHDRAGPFLSDAALTAGRARLPRLTTERADANHLTVLFDPSVPKAIV